MPRTKRKPNELKDMWEEHLTYEIEMLRAVVREFGRWRDHSRFTRNLLIESFAIHVRNLIEFLWPEGEPNKDQVIAEDFLDRPRQPRPQHLRKAYRRVSQEVTHLTYARSHVTREGKRWEVALGHEIERAFDEFVDAIPAETRAMLGPRR